MKYCMLPRSIAAKNESTKASMARHDIMGQSNALNAIGCRADRVWQPHKTTVGIYAEEADKQTGRERSKQSGPISAG